MVSACVDRIWFPDMVIGMLDAAYRHPNPVADTADRGNDCDAEEKRDEFLHFLAELTG